MNCIGLVVGFEFHLYNGRGAKKLHLKRKVFWFFSKPVPNVILRKGLVCGFDAGGLPASVYKGCWK